VASLDLGQPFEQVLATVLSLPPGCGSTGAGRLPHEAEIKQVIHDLYEAANGRNLETSIRPSALSPPLAAFLKTKPFQVATQIDFLVEAATRIIAGPTCVIDATEEPKMRRSAVDDADPTRKTATLPRPRFI
jgi:hypothetical protein